MHTKLDCYGRSVGVLVALAALAAGAAAAAVAYLRGPAPAARAAGRQVELERAVAAVDRELAADLELMSMFDQTKQAFTLENGEFLAHREAIELEAPAAYAPLAGVYERIPATEAAMERRGPAGTVADADLAIVHAWEGDAREAQRALRAALAVPRRTRWDVLAARLRARFASR